LLREGIASGPEPRLVGPSDQGAELLEVPIPVGGFAGDQGVEQAGFIEPERL